MLSVYIFTLVLGGSFLLVSLLGDVFQADADVDTDMDFDLHMSDAADLLDAGDALDAVDAVDAIDAVDAVDVAHAGEAAHAADATHAVKIFSIRGLIYAMFGFGAVGSILTWMGQTAFLTTFLAALVAGVLTGGLVTVVFNWLRATGATNRPGDVGFVGLQGHVTLPMAEGSAGSIAVERGGRRITLRALPYPGVEGDPGEWREVIVLDMEKGIARVAPLEEDLALEP
jgi:hypothetical protein